MRKFPFLLFFILLSAITSVSGQYYNTGQDPASLKWMQVKTGRFSVIYPKDYSEQGLKFAHSLDSAYSKLITLFPEKRFRIPVVIHSYSTMSNGYVAWAPKRIEIYPTPEQNTIPLDPAKQLALHEMAHVFQMEGLNTGFSSVMSVLMGEQFTGIVSSMLPLWFLEGDAVLAETVLSGSGRGRSPSFQKQLRALVSDPGTYYKYDKMINGSYRDFVPDHYQLGYQMVTWAMVKHDTAIWNKTIRFTGQQPFTINPMNISLRRNAGLTKKRLYRETYDSLRNIWSDGIKKATEYRELNPPRGREYVNYYSPVFAGSDSIIAIKTSLYSPPAFVIIKPSSGSESVIFRPGYMYPWLLSFGAGKVVWTETRPDKRWQNRDYSIIRILDIKTGKRSNLSRKTRYLSASISPDGKRICAVENTVRNTNNLVMLDARTGEVIHTAEAPRNYYLQRPQWSAEGNRVTVIYLAGDSEGIMSYDPEKNSWDIVLAPAHDDLQSSFLRNDSLFYISSHSGIDNIYIKTKGRTSQLSHSRFGTSDLNISGGNILFNDYTARGASVCQIPVATGSEPEPLPEESFLANRLNPVYDKTTNVETGSDYAESPYRKWQHLFRFHSWMPLYADIDRIQSDPLSVRPGLSLMSQNSLSTLTTSIGYEYSEDRKHLLHSWITWEGRYPVIESRFDYGHDPAVYGNPAVIRPGIRFSNVISLPFSFSTGWFSQYLRPSVTVRYSNDVIRRTTTLYDYGQVDLTGRLFFSNYSRSADRDIYPRWAQTFDLNYDFAPFDKKIFGKTVFFRSSFFFPGLFRNNGIKLRFEREKQDQPLFIFGNSISFPRAYNNIISRDFSMASADYFFPLAYPDLNLPGILYLKRIRAGLFYDIASGTGNRHYNEGGSGPSFDVWQREIFRSFGTEITGDFHVFRIPYMISGGVRAAWKDINESPVISALFNIDLYGFTFGKKPRY